MKTPLSSILLILTSSLIGSFGAVFLKLGAEHMKGSLGSFFKNYWLAIGVCLYLLSSVFFVMGVAQGELTILYPMVPNMTISERPLVGTEWNNRTSYNCEYCRCRSRHRGVWRA